MQVVTQGQFSNGKWRVMLPIHNLICTKKSNCRRWMYFNLNRVGIGLLEGKTIIFTKDCHSCSTWPWLQPTSVGMLYRKLDSWKQESINGIREFKANQRSVVPTDLKQLQLTVHTLIVSTDECEGLFCAMKYVISHAACNSLRVPDLSKQFFINIQVCCFRTLIQKTVWKWFICCLGLIAHFYIGRKVEEIGDFLKWTKWYHK